MLGISATSYPTIPIQLAQPDPDVDLNLQAVFTLTFDRGRYQRSIDYTQPLAPPLNEQDLRWSEEVIGANKAR